MEIFGEGGWRRAASPSKVRILRTSMFVSFFPRPRLFILSAILWGILTVGFLVYIRRSTWCVAGISIPGFGRKNIGRRYFLVVAIPVVLSVLCGDDFPFLIESGVRTGALFAPQFEYRERCRKTLGADAVDGA